MRQHNAKNWREPLDAVLEGHLAPGIWKERLKGGEKTRKKEEEVGWKGERMALVA